MFKMKRDLFQQEFKMTFMRCFFTDLTATGVCEIKRGILHDQEHKSLRNY